MIATYLAGYIKAYTNSFFGVHFLFSLISLASIGLSYQYYNRRQRHYISIPIKIDKADKDMHVRETGKDKIIKEIKVVK